MTTPSPPGDIFDVKRIRRLLELMNEYDLNELDLKHSDTRIRIRRGADLLPVVETRPAAPSAIAASRPASEATPPSPEVADSKNIAVIKSPMVGTFYASAEPGKPPFVSVGDHVKPDTTVCLIEAMKVFNPIPAEISGRIVAVLAKNEQPVEFNQPLFKVDTSG